MSPITVAIAGGTGKLGVFVTRAFLSGLFNPSKVKRVIVLTHQPSSTTAKELQAQGVEIYDSDITPKTLEGFDAVVNVLGMAASKEVNDTLAQVASEAGVKVYIPNEFGLDMRPLGPYGKPWAIRSTMSTYARELNGGAMKVIPVYPGTFLELIFLKAPLISHDIQNSVFNLFGDPKNRFSYSTWSSSRLATQRGRAISWVDLAKVIEKERGEKITINIGDADILKEKIEEEDDKLSAGRYTYAIGA